MKFSIPGIRAFHAPFYKKIQTKARTWIPAVPAAGAVVSFANPAFALQIHSEPEGLYAHLLAHIFFIITMGIFAFWLGKRALTRERGWRFVRMSCFLFILWNLDAFIGHLMEYYMTETAFAGKGWSRVFFPDAVSFPYLYYALKLDHLLCVPALIFLYVGLTLLKKEGKEEAP